MLKSNKELVSSPLLHSSSDLYRYWFFSRLLLTKKAKWEIGRLDVICGILSLLGIVFWYITRAGNIAIFFSLLADGLAFIPTLVKAYSFPETESSNVFITGVISSGITLLTITHWNFETGAFPLYLFIGDSIASLLIQFQLGKKLKKSLAS